MGMNKNILILGKDGMLGSMIYAYLKNNIKFSVTATARSKNINSFRYFDANEFLLNNSVYKYLLKYDYIINAIGIIKPYCNDNNNSEIYNAIKINSLFPHELSNFLIKNHVHTKIINITTDCVFSGTKGRYKEKDSHDALDVYGKTKSLGESRNTNILNIRCSIIGPETQHKASLMEWLLMQTNENNIQGYTKHLWNGVTTLQYARLCEKLINSNKFNSFQQKSNIYHFVPNKEINKFDLLETINTVFDKKLSIKKNNKVKPINRTLKTLYPEFTKICGNSNINKELLILKNFMEKNNYYSK